MISSLLMSAAFLMGLDAPAREPQMATDGKAVYLTYGAGTFYLPQR